MYLCSKTGRPNGEFRGAQQMYRRPVAARFHRRDVWETFMIRPFDNKGTTL